MQKKNYDILPKPKSSQIFNIFIIVKLFYFQLLIYSIKSQCQKRTPILVGTQCKLEYCTEEQYKNGDCKIANKIIKTQWLTKIIKIGDLNFRYVNFAEFSNGSIIIETTAYPGNEKRMFYGLDIDGRGLFNTDNGSRTYFYSINVGEQPGNPDKTRFEAENFIATINEGPNKGKEYLVSVSKSNKFPELFIFDEGKINQKQTSKFLGAEMNNLRGFAFSYTKDNRYYSLVGIKATINNGNHILLRRLIFKNNKFTETNPEKKEFKRPYNLGDSLSCFITTETYSTICCYLELTPKAEDNNNFCILALNEKLEDPKSSCFSNYVTTVGNTFLKCIHLKGEAGAFTYFNSNNIPIILLKKYNKTRKNFDNYLTRHYYLRLDLYTKNDIYFNNYCLKNDFIKITENKLCFITSSNTNDTLYISILNIFELKDVIIRYYSINIFKLNNYKILLDMRGHLYKNYIALAFSYCRSEICFTDRQGEHFSAFLLFSYPGQKQSKLSIEEYLLDHNDIKINNLLLDFKNISMVDNNLFGYEYKGIKLKENKCDKINILSSITNQPIENDLLVEEEKIKIKFKYILTEPSYENYTNYVEEDNQ